MSNIALLVDLDSCVGCFACQNACKMVNDLPPDVQWLKVMPKEHKPEEVDGTLVMDRFPVPVSLNKCIECPDRNGEEQPLCAKVCMGDALYVGSPNKAIEMAEGRRTAIFMK